MKSKMLLAAVALAAFLTAPPSPIHHILTHVNLRLTDRLLSIVKG